MTRGTHTLAEITSQPDIWRDALQIFSEHAAELIALWEQHKFDRVLLTGCGSTYYASLIGEVLFQSQIGIPCRALPASELMLFPNSHYGDGQKTLLITVSREGKTRETLEAARLFHAQEQGMVLAITCQSESVLAQEADFVLAIDSAREVSRAQTRSFSSMVLMLQALALTFAGQDALSLLAKLPASLESLVTRYEALINTLGQDLALEQFLFLGSGPVYGLACEAMLKALETTLVPSMAFHTLEFLHGPKYIVNSQTLVVGLLTDALRDEEVKAIEEARQRQGTCLVISDSSAQLAPDDHIFQITLETGLPIEARAILYLPLLQRLVYQQSTARGLNPDLPGQHG